MRLKRTAPTLLGGAERRLRVILSGISHGADHRSLRRQNEPTTLCFANLPSPMTDAQHTELLRPTEVARRLSVSRTWLYEAARDGRIPSVRIGGPQGPLRFVPQDIDEWIDRARAAWRPADSPTATLRRAGGVER